MEFCLGFSSTSFLAPLSGYLLVSSFLFVFGICACITRRNAIGILIGIELMLNASVLNFLAFSRFNAGNIDGVIMGAFIIVLAACEAAVALAILLNLYFNLGTIDVDYAHEMKQ
jgi:NADH:ubiquinone oxidoreductase subunit K